MTLRFLRNHLVSMPQIFAELKNILISGFCGICRLFPADFRRNYYVMTLRILRNHLVSMPQIFAELKNILISGFCWKKHICLIIGFISTFGYPKNVRERNFLY